MDALVIVDMQVDFVYGALGTPEARRIVPLVARKLLDWRASGGSVFFTRDTHDEGYLRTREGHDLPVPHCLRGTPGWALIPSLDAQNDPIFDKAALGSLELALTLRDRRPAHVELCGVCTDICVLANALLLRSVLPDVPLTVDAACCAGTVPERHLAALHAMEGCHIRIARASAGQARAKPL